MTIDNSAEICRNPGCEYNNHCRFVVSQERAKKTPESSWKIFKNRLAILHIVGSIDSDIENITSELVERTGDFDGLFVDINSGGGNAGSCRKIVGLLRKIGKQVPIVTNVRYAGSAALEIAQVCPEIFIEPEGEGGSLGILKHVCFNGEKPRAFTSSKSTEKPFDIEKGPISYDPRLFTDEIGEEIQQAIDTGLARVFKSIVADRGIDGERIEALTDGRMVEASELVQMGLADGVCAPEEALAVLGARMKSIGLHNSDARVNQLRAKNLDRLRAQAITRSEKTEADDLEENRLFRQIDAIKKENEVVEIRAKLAELVEKLQWIKEEIAEIKAQHKNNRREENEDANKIAEKE
jgi:ClpP class serine protease